MRGRLFRALAFLALPFSIVLLALGSPTADSPVPDFDPKLPAASSRQVVASNQSSLEHREFAPQQVIVKFTKKSTAADRRAAVLSSGGVGYHPLSELAPTTMLVKLRFGTSVEEAVDRLSSTAVVSYAEPNYVIHALDLPDDPVYASGELWGMQGPDSGSPYGANSDSAWAAGYQGDQRVVVAVLDQGINYEHEDLAQNIWTNPGEVPRNGLDDDGNGFVDDVHGYDHMDLDGEVMPYPLETHGTHVAGTIGAVGGNGLGVIGVSPKVSLISVRILNAAGNGTTASAIAGIDYVNLLRTKQGVPIAALNNSWSFGSDYSKAMRDAIRRVGDAGMIFVAAAGNSGLDLEQNFAYPAQYHCETPSRPWNCVVTVAAIGSDGELAPYSNYGSTRVALAAPGTNILSTTGSLGYLSKSGTSMAAPHVTGAIALCVAANRGMPAFEVIELLSETSRPTASLEGKVSSGGILDAAALASSCGQRVEAFSGEPTEATASAIYTNRVRLDWADTVEGEYGFEILIAEGPAGCSGVFTHYAYIGPGLTSYPITGLAESEFYCFKLRAVRDDASTPWVSSNLTITWASNLPFLTGRVLLADGVTPVHRAMVSWWVLTDVYRTQKLTTYTDVDGGYVLQVPNDINGWVAVSAPPVGPASKYAKYYVHPSPQLPAGMLVGADMVTNVDREQDITLPPIRTVTVTAVDGETGDAVPGTLVGGDSTVYTGVNCSTFSDYRPWPGADISGASLWKSCVSDPFGASPVFTDINGKAQIAFFDHSVVPHEVTFSASHPQDLRRTVQQTLKVDADHNVTLKLPALRTLTGRVYMSDGVTPVSNIKVAWWPSTDTRMSLRRSTFTDADGAYSIQVPENTKIWLAAQNDNEPEAAGLAGVYPSPAVPAYLTVGAWKTLTGDSSQDITLPPFRNIEFEVVDGNTGEPVAGAPVQGDISIQGGVTCDVWSNYRPWLGASVDDVYWKACLTVPFGYSINRPPKSGADGTFRMVFLDHSIMPFPITMSVTHPDDAVRVGELTFDATSDSRRTIVLPAVRNLTGTVWMADGVTPVGSIKVTWKASADIRGIHKRFTYTDANGHYTLPIPESTRGWVSVETPDLHPSSRDGDAGLVYVYPNQQLPAGMSVGGWRTIAGDEQQDITLPPIRVVELEVVEVYTNDPVAGADVIGDMTTWGGVSCEAFSSYRAWPGADVSNYFFKSCISTPFGRTGSPAVTDANGKVTLSFFDHSILPVTVKAAATHPLDSARVGEVSFVATADQQLRIVLPGTPGIPKRPAAQPSDGSVTLNWTEPWDGGAYIDYYNVWWATDINGPYTQVESGSCAGKVSSADRTCVVEGLTSGVKYFFAIIAHNVVGSSNRSVATAVVPIDSSLSPPQMPELSEPIRSSNGFSVEVLNADSSHSYTGEVTGGSVSIQDSAGGGVRLTVAGLQPAEAAQLIVSSACEGCNTGVGQVESSALRAFDSVPTPAVSGVPRAGESLSIDPGLWPAGTVLAYQWLRDGKVIAGATGSSYLVTVADEGRSLTVRVTAAADGYSTVTTLSGPTLVPPSLVLGVSSQLVKRGDLVAVDLSAPAGIVELAFGVSKKKVVVPLSGRMSTQYFSARSAGVFLVTATATGGRKVSTQVFVPSVTPTTKVEPGKVAAVLIRYAKPGTRVVVQVADGTYIGIVGANNSLRLPFAIDEVGSFDMTVTVSGLDAWAFRVKAG